MDAMPTCSGLLLTDCSNTNTDVIFYQKWTQCFASVHGTVLFLFRCGSCAGHPLGKPFRHIELNRCQIFFKSHKLQRSVFNCGFSIRDPNNCVFRFLCAGKDACRRWVFSIIQNNLEWYKSKFGVDKTDKKPNSLLKLVSSWHLTFAEIKFISLVGGLISIFSDNLEFNLKRIQSPETNPTSGDSSDSGDSGEPSCGLHSQTVFGDVKIFLFSWNMGAKDLFPGVNQSRRAFDMFAHNLIPHGYDIYVVGLQESVSDSLLEVLDTHLAESKCSRISISEECSRVVGRGDGSFLNPKYTGIAVYISERIRTHTYLLASVPVSFGVMEGSKGGAAVLLRVFGTTCVFCSVHMPASSALNRRLAYGMLVDRIGKAFGNSFFQMLEQFHHIVIFGDLNYRLNSIDSRTALRMITDKQLTALRWHDGLVQDMNDEKIFFGFKEPIPDSTFEPTYKKFEQRTSIIDRSDLSWVYSVYRTMYKQPWYKRGQVEQRIPSFTDRVLVHSMPDMAADLHPLRADDGSPAHLYGCLSHDLTGSDHSAIRCGLNLRIQKQPPLLPSAARFFSVTVLDVRVESFPESGCWQYPRYFRCLFPAPYECSDSHAPCTRASEKLVPEELWPAGPIVGSMLGLPKVLSRFDSNPRWSSQRHRNCATPKLRPSSRRTDARKQSMRFDLSSTLESCSSTRGSGSSPESPSGTDKRSDSVFRSWKMSDSNISPRIAAEVLSCAEDEDCKNAKKLPPRSYRRTHSSPTLATNLSRTRANRRSNVQTPMVKKLTSRWSEHPTRMAISRAVTTPVVPSNGSRRKLRISLMPCRAGEDPADDISLRVSPASSTDYLNYRTQFVAQSVVPSPILHFLIKIRTADDRSCQGVVRLAVSDFERGETREFKTTLTRHGLPVYRDSSKSKMGLRLVLSLKLLRD
eukprot:303240_1